MLTLIFLSIVSVILIGGAILIDKRDSWDLDWLVALLIVISGLCITALIVCLLSLINIDRDFDAKIEQYEAITAMVDSYNGQDYGNMTPLVEEVVNMNNCIAKHKAFYDSPWNGLWYSSRIAELEPIRFDKKTDLTE